MNGSPLPLNPEILLAHAEFLRRLARNLLIDRDHADDLVQETWVVALEKPPRHGGSLRGWLATVARNLARRRFQREQARLVWESEAAQHDRLPLSRTPRDVSMSTDFLGDRYK